MYGLNRNKALYSTSNQFLYVTNNSSCNIIFKFSQQYAMINTKQLTLVEGCCR